jgi:hypothetical protein
LLKYWMKYGWNIVEILNEILLKYCWIIVELLLNYWMKYCLNIEWNILLSIDWFLKNINWNTFQNIDRNMFWYFLKCVAAGRLTETKPYVMIYVWQNVNCGFS